MLSSQQAKLAQGCLIAVCSVAFALLSWRLYVGLEKQAAAQHRLAELVALQAKVDREYQQAHTQWDRDLQQWRAETARITEQNRRALAQWRANPVERIVKPLPRSQIVREVLKDSSAGPVAAAPAMIMESQPEYLVIERLKSPPTLKTAPEPPAAPTRIKISVDSVELELDNNTGWQTIAQLLVLILGLYGGMKMINRLTYRPEAA